MSTTLMIHSVPVQFKGEHRFRLRESISGRLFGWECCCSLRTYALRYTTQQFAFEAWQRHVKRGGKEGA